MTNFTLKKIACLVRKINCIHYRARGVRIGRDVFISLRSFIDVTYPGSITIEDGAYITVGAKLIAHDHTSYRRKPMHEDDGRGYIIIKKNAFVGVGAIIMRNVTVGENAIVGAGAVVTKDVPSNSIVVGNPAKILKTFDLI